MAPSPTLTPALTSLRAEFNTLWPNRDKSSDGWIGDAAHRSSQSDHNDDEVGNVPIHDADVVHEVHAIDIDRDLGDDGDPLERAVQHLVARHRSGADNRLRYVVYKRRIWSASWDWATHPYTGANPHDHHAHFSGSYVSAKEADTRPWHLEDIDMPSIEEIRKAIRDELVDQRDDIVKAVWAHQLDVDVSAGGVNKQGAGSVLAYTSSEHHRIEGKVDDVESGVAAIAARLPAPPAR